MFTISEDSVSLKERKKSICNLTKLFQVLIVVMNVFFLIYTPFQILVFSTPFPDAAQPGFPWGISCIFLFICSFGLYSSFSDKKKLNRRDQMTRNLLKMHKFNVFANLLFVLYLSTMLILYYTIFVTIFNEISGFYLYMVLTTLVSFSIVIIHHWIKSEDCDK